MAHAHAHHPTVKMGLPIPNSKLGMWLFLGTEIMFFTALIGTYIVYRIATGTDWPTPEETHIEIWAGGINTFVLILSSYFVVVAHEAIGLKNYAKAWKFLLWTFLLACLFLGIKSFEYYGKYQHDLLPGRVAETDVQAMNKVVRQMDEAVTARRLALIPGEDHYQTMRTTEQIAWIEEEINLLPRAETLAAAIGKLPGGPRGTLLDRLSALIAAEAGLQNAEASEDASPEELAELSQQLDQRKTEFAESVEQAEGLRQAQRSDLNNLPHLRRLVLPVAVEDSDPAVRQEEL
ncbi:MAG: cytochrome c oxidase subunit 3, partial [Planctomycetaceae bacterium]